MMGAPVPTSLLQTSPAGTSLRYAAAAWAPAACQCTVPCALAVRIRYAELWKHCPPKRHTPCGGETSHPVHACKRRVETKGMMGTNRYAFERYLNVRTARDPSFSPDGRRLSFITDITGVAEVWTVPVTPASEAPSWPHQITFRGERSDSATYAPDAPMLLVAADARGAEPTQPYLVSRDGVTFTPLTDQPGVIHTFCSLSPHRHPPC